MSFTEEHSYGSYVDLYKQGDELFGIFYNSAGLQGDTPCGFMHDIRYTAQTGKLSFIANLKTGITWDSAKNVIDKHDIFVFKGQLNPDAIVGLLEWRTGLKENFLIQPKTKVILKKQANKNMDSRKFTTRNEWEIDHEYCNH